MCSGGWIKDHKKELLAALAIGGVGAATGGFGLLAAPAVAGEAAVGGLLGGELAGGLGAGAAEEIAGMGLLASQAPAGNAASIGIGNTLSGLGLSTEGLGTGLERAGRIASAVPRGTQPQPMPAPPMGVQPLQTQSGIPSLAQTYPVNVVDDERKRRKMRGMYG